ncbi:MAG: hydroxymethylglutaryl-CoA reductase, degradative [Candidatus Micrarchaeota archaeon]|nr:hydroxymethylglutaryl-CoA reductase, degradative [Candidatus Micrarchaeota archaeon]
MPEDKFSGLYKRPPEERLAAIASECGLSSDEMAVLRAGGLTIAEADLMRENVIGLYSLPLSVATGFRINGKDYLIPMVGEEPSVVAGASKVAKMAREFGGFTAVSTEPVMIGEISLLKPDPDVAVTVAAHKQDLLKVMNELAPTMSARGGGPRDVWAREYACAHGRCAVVYFSVDVRDAMGANTVNRIAEGLAPAITSLVGGKVVMRILTNLSVKRISRARAQFTDDPEMAKGILFAQSFAENDIFRAVTHNKGIMNGISALALATGNDTRAVEAGAHGYAAYSSFYRPLTKYYIEDGKLIGEIELPLALGTVGSGTSHKAARICLDKILKVKSSQELCNIAAALGLAQNFAAIRALTQEGINKGHMRLHSKTLALMAGATLDEAVRIYEHFRNYDGEVTMSAIKHALDELRKVRR